jgi:hypothetical protein
VPENVTVPDLAIPVFAATVAVTLVVPSEPLVGLRVIHEGEEETDHPWSSLYTDKLVVPPEALIGLTDVGDTDIS